MAHVIDKAILDATTDIPDVAEIWNATENLYAYYYTVHGVFPRYLYVNDRTWQHLSWYLGHKVEAMGLHVIDSPFMPPNRISLHFQEHPHREIAKWHRSFGDDEGTDAGKLEIV